MNAISVSESTCCRGIDSLIESAVKSLENLGYKRGTIRNYRYTWKEFCQFALENSGDKTFSTDLVCKFLKSFGISSDKVEIGLTFRQRHIRNVKYALTEFVLHGCFQRRSHVTEKTKLSDNMQEILSAYEQFCHEQSWSPLGIIRSRKRDITRFLHYLDSHGISTVKEIQALTLSRFVTSCAHLKPATLAQMDAISRQAGAGAEVKILPDCGHSPHKDQAEKTFEAMKAFISKIL